MTDNARRQYDAETMPRLARQWREEGATLEQIAARLGVELTELLEWQGQYGELADALKDVVHDVDSCAEEALLKRAQGFHYDEVTTDSTTVTMCCAIRW